MGEQITILSSCTPTFLVRRKLPSGFWKVQAVKDLRVVDGKREWLIGWAGADDEGDAWPDSWEPSKLLTPDLIDHFLRDRKERLLRVIPVDGRPLDSMVQRKIAHAVANELSCVETFGRVHEIAIDALQLRDLAVAYFNSVVARFNLTPKSVYEPKSRVTCHELRIKNPDDVGEFCAFEAFMNPNSGVGALRFALGRKSNMDAVVVSPISMWYEDNAHTPGCVNFTVEICTCKINGATGSLTPPHLGASSKNLLKTDAYKNRVITYVRENLPRSHPLRAAGWHNLPSHVHAIA